MPLSCNDEMASYVYLAREERQVCPRIQIKVREDAPR